jgi:tRNA dimethylallyltransferase
MGGDEGGDEGHEGAGQQVRYSAVLIAGPTASGKSALAVELARRFGGVVVNADSMQVYRDLEVITARPTPEEMGEVPHRLYGHIDGAANHSAAAYAAEVTALLQELAGQGALPVLVGGTGLYFKALTEGLSDIPPVPDEVRVAFRARAEQCETSELHAELAGKDPQMAARLRPSDRLRVMRALEVFEATGRSLATFQGSRRPGPLAGQNLLKIFLAPERELVRARIDARFDVMMSQGALDEVAALRERRLDPLLPVMRAHGVPGLIAYLDGKLSLDEAVVRGKADTRAYAKRQVTWFRHQMGGWIAAAPEAALDVALAACADEASIAGSNPA